MSYKNQILVCGTCGVEFTSSKNCKTRKPKFCSKKCYGKSIEIHKFCKLCGEEIKVNNTAKKHRIYCSYDCSHSARKGIKFSESWKKAISEGRKNSDKCKGENLYNWKGGYENVKIYQKKRYHQKRAAGIIDFEYLKILFKLQGGECYYCGSDITKKGKKHIEHLVPISRGGGNDWMNLVYSCGSCNSKKNTMTLAEYAIKNIRPDWLNNMIQFNAKKLQTYVNRNKKNS